MLIPAAPPLPPFGEAGFQKVLVAPTCRAAGLTKDTAPTRHSSAAAGACAPVGVVAMVAASRMRLDARRTVEGWSGLRGGVKACLLAT